MSTEIKRYRRYFRKIISLVLLPTFLFSNISFALAPRLDNKTLAPYSISQIIKENEKDLSVFSSEGISVGEKVNDDEADRVLRKARRPDEIANAWVTRTAEALAARMVARLTELQGAGIEIPLEDAEEHLIKQIHEWLRNNDAPAYRENALMASVRREFVKLRQDIPLPPEFSPEKYEWVLGQVGEEIIDKESEVAYRKIGDKWQPYAGGVPENMRHMVGATRDIVKIFGQRRGFSNGVETKGKLPEDIEREIIQNILGLRILGEKIPPHIKAIELLPRHWDYKPGLYTHGELKERPFWKNYFTYLTGRDMDSGNAVPVEREKSVIYHELKGFAKAEGKVSGKNAISTAKNKIDSLNRDKLVKELEIRHAEFGPKEPIRILRGRLKRLKEEEIIEQYAARIAEQKYELVSKAVANVLNWKPQILSHSLREYLTNLYALAVVRTTMKAVLLNDPKADLFNPHEETNAQANRTAIEIVRNEKRAPAHHEPLEELKRWLKLAIGGGIVDLNSPLIRAEYEEDTNTFMQKYFESAAKKEFGHLYFQKDFEYFCNKVVLSKPRMKLVYFLDNNGEAVFDLAFIQKIMETNPNLTVYLIPKSAQVSNDASYSDIENIFDLDSSNTLFASLRKFESEGRFVRVQDGPDIQGVDGRSISQELASALEPEADRRTIGFFCGQANFETTQGWNIDRFYKLIAKGEGLEKASGFDRESKAFIFAYVPSGVPVGTGDGYFKISKDPSGKKKDGKTAELITARQTLFDFKEAINSPQYGKLKETLAAGTDEEAIEKILQIAEETNKTFAEVVFDYDVELYESLVKLGLMERVSNSGERGKNVELVFWGALDRTKSEFRKDVERLSGIGDLVDSQRFDRIEAEKRARAYLRTIVIKTARQYAPSAWEDIRDNQGNFNRMFGASQIVAVAGKASRYSRYIHKALVTADQGETNVRLAINASYKTPETKPVIVISPNQLRWIVKDKFIPRDPTNAKAIEKGDMPNGWSEGVIPEDRIDPRKKAKYFTEDATILLGEPLGHGYVLTSSIEYLKGNGLLGETAYKQIVFGEMATVQDRTKSNASLITYMEAVIGDYLITAGGKKAEQTKKGKFELDKKGNFFLRGGKLTALTDWARIPKERQRALSELGQTLKSWQALPYYKRQDLRDEYAIDSEGNILINSNTVVFRNDIERYLTEFNNKSLHPEYWLEDPKTGNPLSLAWDMIDLVSKKLGDPRTYKEVWPIGFVDTGNAASSIKDVSKQTEFTHKHKAQLRNSITSILSGQGVELEKNCDLTVTLDSNAQFDLGNLDKLFTNGKNARDIKFAGRVRLVSGMKIGDRVIIDSGTFAGRVNINNGAEIRASYVEGTYNKEAVIPEGCVIERSIIPAGRIISKSVKGLMMPERRIANILSNKATRLDRCKRDFYNELINTAKPGRYASMAAVLLEMLMYGEKNAQQRVKSLLIHAANSDISEYATLIRQMITISPVFNGQSKLFVLIADLGQDKDIPSGTDQLNFEIIIDAIDEQLLTFDLPAFSMRAPQFFPYAELDDWIKQYGKSIEFFEQILTSETATHDKKREVLTELIHRYPFGSSDIKKLYRKAIGVDLIDDLKQNWHENKSVRAVAEVLVGEQALQRLDKIYEITGPGPAELKLEKALDLVIGENSAAYDEILEIFGGIRGHLNGFIDRVMIETGASFEDVVLAENNPLDADNGQAGLESAWESPNFLALMGGTGGRPALLMENLLNELFGENVTSAALASPHDDGGSSRTAQETLIKAEWGYMPSPGDAINVLSAATIREGDPFGAKRDIMRMRFDKGEKFKKQAEKIGLKPEDGFEKWLVKFLQLQTDELVAKDYEGTPLDWLYFIKYVKGVARALDNNLIIPGKLKLEGGSVGNFIFIGHHIKEGALSERGTIGPRTYNPSLFNLARNLGLRTIFHIPSTLEAATLYAKLEALELLVGGESVQLRTKGGDERESLDVRTAGISGAIKEEKKSFTTKIGGVDIEIGLDTNGKITVVVNGIKTTICEEFSKEISSDNSKTVVRIPWDPSKQPQFITQHGRFKIDIVNPTNNTVEYKVEEFVTESYGKKPEISEGDTFTLEDKRDGTVIKIEEDTKKRTWNITVSIPRGRHTVDYGQEISISNPEGKDRRAASVKISQDNNGSLTAELNLDTKGQGTTVYFDKTPVAFRGRLIIEQTNITESLHTSRIIEAGFVDGARPTANPMALDLIKNTKEMITIGPGSFVTSILPIFMIPEIVDAFRERKAKELPIVFFANPFKDNETVDCTITHFVELLERVINKDRPKDRQIKAEEVISHIIVNNAETLPEHLKPLMYELTDEKIKQFMAKPRDPGDFAGPAKLSRGPLDISEREMKALSGIKIYREALATEIPREVRTPGKAQTEYAIGYDEGKLGQIIEHIVLEQKLSRLKPTPIYKRVLRTYYKGDEELLEADINRLLYEAGWLYTAGAVIRTPLEVLSEIERKRLEVTSAYITNDDIAENPPRIVFANTAHTLLQYKKPTPDSKIPVKEISESMKESLSNYLVSGRILVLFTALSLGEVQASLVKPLQKYLKKRNIDKTVLKQIVLVPYAGTRVWRLRDDATTEEKPLIDYSDRIGPDQLETWRKICENANDIYGLNRHLYETVNDRSRMIDGPVIINDRDGLLINFEMDGRRNMPDQVVAEINEGLAKRGVPQIKKVGILNDERDAVIEYLNGEFKRKSLPIVAEKGGTGAINTRYTGVDKAKIAKEIIRILSKEASEMPYQESDIYVIGKGNETILQAFPEATGIYFREEPTSRLPRNVRVYQGTYGIPGVEEFFSYLPLQPRPASSKGSAAAVSGKELTSAEEDQMHEIIEEAFNPVKPIFLLSFKGDVEVYVIPGLEECDSFLIAHPGRGGEAMDHSRRRIYLSPTREKWINHLSAEAQNQFWSHEIAHLDYPEATEEEIQKLAPINLIFAGQPQAVISDVEKLMQEITTHSLLRAEGQIDLSKIAIVMRQDLPEAVTGEKDTALSEILKREYQVMKQRLRKALPRENGIVEVATKEELIDKTNNLIGQGLKVVVLDDGTLTNSLDERHFSGRAGEDYAVVAADGAEGLDNKTIQFVNLNAMALMGISILNKDTLLFQLAYKVFTGKDTPIELMDDIAKRAQWFVKALPRVISLTDDLSDNQMLRRLFQIAA